MEQPITPQTLYTFVGDTSPAVNFTIQREPETTGGQPTPVDLTACEVDFYIQNPNTKMRTNTTDHTCTITSASTGSVTYSWGVNDLPVEGIYNANLKITYQGGQVETAPVSIEVGLTV
jgi:hypothetical protein